MLKQTDRLLSKIAYNLPISIGCAMLTLVTVDQADSDEKRLTKTFRALALDIRTCLPAYSPLIT